MPKLTCNQTGEQQGGFLAVRLSTSDLTSSGNQGSLLCWLADRVPALSFWRLADRAPESRILTIADRASAAGIAVREAAALAASDIAKLVALAEIE